MAALLLNTACGGKSSDTGKTSNEQGSDDADGDDAEQGNGDSEQSDDANQSNGDSEQGDDTDSDDPDDDEVGTDPVNTDATAAADDTDTTASSDDGTSDNGTGDDVAADIPVGPRAQPPIDLLFVVDNSRHMGPKQALLAQALPELVDVLLAPPCMDDQGTLVPPGPNAECPTGTQHVFAPITDLHIGVITTSLGGYGASVDCTANGAANPDALQQVDMAELLGSLPRGAAVSPASAATGFLTWTGGTDTQTSAELASLVVAAGEFGCGFEAPLEAWHRFLVDPYPYTRIVRRSCNSMDTSMSCTGPEVLADSNDQLVNDRILAQRAAFLRPDSVLAVVMFSDENDCSFKPYGQTWRLAQTANTNGEAITYSPAFRGTAACNNPEFGPNHECCHSCGQASTPSACATALDPNGQAVPVGCEVSRKFKLGELGDNPNLRCFEQKRRFGVDYLYPVERYSAALLSAQLCPWTDTLALEGCEGDPVANPLYADLNVNPYASELPARPRSVDDVFLVGILGVPWQDLVEDHTASTPTYRVARADAPDEERINWDWIIGQRQPTNGIPAPLDPLMRESVQPRQGMVPSTGEALAAPGSGVGANAANGHEWLISDESQLQYACIFPMPERKCPSKDEETTLRREGQSVAPCQCTETPGDEWSNPACQAPDGTFDDIERNSAALPGLRQLQVLHDVGDHAVVASICPWNVDDPGAADYGYRPVIKALFERLRERLQ